VRAVIERERNELLAAADESANLELPDDAAELRGQATALDTYLSC
jgi:hypothetical protein